MHLFICLISSTHYISEAYVHQWQFCGQFDSEAMFLSMFIFLSFKNVVFFAPSFAYFCFDTRIQLKIILQK